MICATLLRMKKTLAIALGLSSCVTALGSCETRTTATAPAPKPAPSTPPPPPPGSAVCNIDVMKPGRLRRGGTANVQLTGKGIGIDAHNVPALCGPLFDIDVPALNVQAGDGLFFETCLPEGTLQIMAANRVAGRQSVHGVAQSAGTEVAFNQNKAGTYTTRSEPSDSIVFSDDLWKADVEVTLHSVAENAPLRAKVSFDCPAVGPWEDQPTPKAP